MRIYLKEIVLIEHSVETIPYLLELLLVLRAGLYQLKDLLSVLRRDSDAELEESHVLRIGRGGCGAHGL
jgi:hypothetical protein